MMSERIVDAMDQADIDQFCGTGQTVVVINAPDIAVGFHLYFFRRLWRLPMPAGWRVLSWAPYDHRVERTDLDSIELVLVGGSIEAPSLTVGDLIEIDGMHSEVLRIGRSGPSRISFRFDRPLDDRLLVLLVWQDGRLQRCNPPGIGKTICLNRQ
jgi:hypothetical protein